MRILMLGCKEYPYGVSSKFEKYPGGGTAKYVINLSEGLVENGHEVHLIVRRFPGQKRYEKKGNLHIYRVGFIKNKYMRNLSFAWSSSKEAKKIVSQNNIDVVHTHGIFGAQARSLLNKNILTVSTLHGVASTQVSHNYNSFITKLISIMQKRVYRKSDLILYLSKSEKKDFLSKTPFKNKNSDIIFPSIKESTVRLVKHKDFNVVFIGRLVPMKGLDKLIESFNYLPETQKKTTRYVVVGNGFEKGNLEKLSEKLGLSDKIIFTGYTNKIEKYLSKADLFILPSEGGEGLPAALLEAMSAGIPCVLSNFDAPIAKSAYSNLKNNTPKTIAREISRLFKDSKARQTLATNAKKEYFNNFSMEKFVKKHIEKYEALI